MLNGKNIVNKLIQRVRRLFIVLICLFVTKSSWAQIYPIQATTILIPPFSGYIPDYAASGNEQMKILLTLNDFTQPNYQVKLKIRIEGQGIAMQSKPFYFTSPILLTPGVPVEITGSDLSGLLSTSNLDITGISVSTYNQNKVLPEGLYSICVTAYDYNNPLPVQVSNTSCAQAWMMLNDPPFLNTPFCGSQLSMLNPQQITFTWTPMNLVSPNSFNQTEYEFSLYEIRPNGQNPNIVIQNSAPIYQTTTSLTVLNYGLTEPPLLSNMSYAWRVRAIDLSGRDWFKNNGYSQVCVFKWGNELDQLGNAAQINIHAQGLTQRRGRAWWDSLNVYATYHFEFRKSGTQNWFPAHINRSSCFVNDLEAATAYEVRVQGETPDGALGPYSNTATFTTLPLPQYVCGQLPAPVNMQNFVPLQSATIAQIWQVGQFEMIVTGLDNTISPNGVYSGYGKVLLGFAGMNVNCKFTQVMVDNDHLVRMGVVRVLNEPLQQWINGQLQVPDFVYDGDADSVYTQNGYIIIVDENGTETQIDWPQSGDYVIQDENGDQWIVHNDGTVTFQPLVPHIELSENEKAIYRMAMLALKQQYSDGQIVSQGKSNYNTKKGAASQFVSGSFGMNYLDVDTASTGSGYGFFVEDNAAGSLTSPYSPIEELRQARIDMDASKATKAFARVKMGEKEYDLLAGYLTINGRKSIDYVRDELDAGKDAEVLAGEIKEGIILFIHETFAKRY